MKKIVFITGTRADYGKIKSLLYRVENSERFEAYIYVSGMHLLEIFGNTYKEILKDKYRNIHIAYGLANTRITSYDLGNVICDFTGYVKNIKPDMIVVHGDRVDALAGAIVGALNNICVAHIEGGELSGTIDESIRHAISKFAHLHFVANEEAKKHLIQLGEDVEHIFVIGSPDIDIMISKSLPNIELARQRYDMNFVQYGILMYHPVTTEYKNLNENIHIVTNALLRTKENIIVIYPNNDLGYEIILNEYRRFDGNNRFKVYPSVRFEYFLTFLKNAKFIIGNSSAGIREAAVYGLPAIDIGNRQEGRYNIDILRNIQHVNEDEKEIIFALDRVEKYRFISKTYGEGNSADSFMTILEDEKIWGIELQKRFYEVNW